MNESASIAISGLFPAIALCVWIGVPTYAGLARGRLYAAFSGVLLTFSIPAALVLHHRLRALALAAAGPEGGSVALALDLLFAYSMAAAGIQLAHLVRARMRGSLFRWLVSIPGQTFLAAGLLAGPWLLLLLPFRLLFGALDWQTMLLAWTIVEAMPLFVSITSILTSTLVRDETVRFHLPDPSQASEPRGYRRVPVERFHGTPPPPLENRPLRIVQLTDTHLGPWQSVNRLHGLVESLVARDPDLVLLTGDFLTMESMGTPGCLEQALAPLASIADRCVAIFGNHDHEAPDDVKRAMQHLGIELLIDREAIFETPLGPVQIVGADFVGKGHAEHLGDLLSRFPRRADHLRVLLLHDPIGFHALPEDNVDLVFSGHTHGGHVGLVSLGLDWTALSFSRWPDQGLFARGNTRLYVHRGTGFYGFPLRVGVPAEHSLLEIRSA